MFQVETELRFWKVRFLFEAIYVSSIRNASKVPDIEVLEGPRDGFFVTCRGNKSFGFEKKGLKILPSGRILSLPVRMLRSHNLRYWK